MKEQWFLGVGIGIAFLFVVGMVSYQNEEIAGQAIAPVTGEVQPIGGTTGYVKVTGTAGYLSKWTSTSSIGNSLVADVNGNVGIGTNNPNYKLDVRGGGIRVQGGVGYFETMTAGDVAATIMKGTDPKIIFYAQNGNGGIGFKYGTMYVASDRDILLVNVTGPETMRITPGGRVGIGTATPDSSLNIVETKPLTSGGIHVFTKAATSVLDLQSGFGASIRMGENGQNNFMFSVYPVRDPTGKSNRVLEIIDFDQQEQQWTPIRLDGMTRTIQMDGELFTSDMHVGGKIYVGSLDGPGKAYACIDDQGAIYRSTTPCV